MDKIILGILLFNLHKRSFSPLGMKDAYLMFQSLPENTPGHRLHATRFMGISASAPRGKAFTSQHGTMDRNPMHRES